MPPNKPQPNYSKRPVRRVRVLKFGPRTTKSLFEEHFYAFLVMICVAVSILGKAGGLGGYDAIVTGLWTGGFTWFVWQVRRYRREQAGGKSPEKSRRVVKAPLQMTQQPLPPNMKPMIGPQWPLKTLPGAARPVQRPFKPAVQETMKPAQTPAPGGQAPGAPSNPNKPAFLYERPTLPDRKPKLPNNWPGRPDKKPKR
jgi:hypothetical protein